MTFGNTINAGITRQLDQMLPNNERITRSIHNPVEDDIKSLETIPVEDSYTKHRRLDRPVRSANNYDLNTAENNVVFKPLFRKRPNRRVLREAKSNMDMDMQTAENGLVFRPLFRRNQNLQNLRRSRRAAADDMQTAENNIVFKPLFRKHPIRRVRSADSDLEIAESQYAAYYENNEKKNDDIFPSVKEHEINTDKDASSEETQEEATVDEVAEETRVRRAAAQNGDEVMDTAANTIVFRPLFRNNRRNFNRQRN